MNISEFRDQLLSELRHKFTEGESFAIAREMVFHLKGVLPPYPLHAEINSEESVKADEWMKRVNAGEPLQYVLGKVQFRNFELIVNPSVLIPRPETEELPDLIMADSGNKPRSIIDLGTGSGCIIIALAKFFPSANCKACDISLEALQTASENATMNNVNVHFFWQDMNDQDFLKATDNYDLIVSNPPYIGAAEFHSLEKTVLDHEPHTALFAPTDDPVHYYRRIAAFARKNLNENGSVWLEINPLHADETADVFRHVGMSDVRIYPDLTGKDRFIAAFN